jgi:fructosamine-3-kinase
MIENGIARRIATLLGQSVVDSRPLGGGCVAEVRELDLADGSRCVVKLAAEGGLDVEAWMLRYLAASSRLPVPAVLYGDDTLLVLERVTGDASGIGRAAELDAADHLAALHEVTSGRFGLERDTVIGGLHQPNPWSESWRSFFRDHRLLYMGRRALDAGAISSSCFARLERLGGRLDAWLSEPSHASLVHGDVWGGNVLVHHGRLAAFIDPAIYFADPEVELAFITLFSTFGDAFFRRYAAHRRIDRGFFEVRRDLYNLYPLLVHAVLFGSAYGQRVERTLTHLVG